MGELKWFFIFIALLFVAWLYTGGLDRVDVNRQNPFIEQPAPVESGKIYGIDELKDRTRP